MDTNVLLLIFEGIPVFDLIENALNTKCEFIVITPILHEIQKISKSRSIKRSKAAELAIKVINDYCNVYNFPISANEKVDDALIRAAEKMGALIATNDKELRKNLRKKGISHVYYRESEKLFEVWGEDLC